MNYGDSTLETSNSQLSLQPEVKLEFADFLINQVVDAAFCLGKNAQFLYVNNPTCYLTEYSRDELLSMNLGDLDIDFSLQNWSELWKDTNIYHRTFKSRYCTKTGRIFLGEINLTYIKHQGREFNCAIFREISDELVELSMQNWELLEHKQSPVHLQENIAELKYKQFNNLLWLKESGFLSLVEAINANIFLIQGKKICYANSAAELLTGYSNRELLAGVEFNQVIKSRKSQQSQETNSEYQELKILTKQGKERWLVGVWTRLDKVLNFEGEDVEVLTTIDITDYKYAESKLQNTLEEAKKNSELRAHLVAIVSHQFRTPLNVISFSNSLLKRHINKWKGEKIQLFLEKIAISVKEITQVLDDIWFFSTTDLEKVQIDPQQVDLVEFCHDLIKNFLLINSEYHIKFYHQGNCAKVWIDTKLLKPILNNLLANAIKYSPNNNVIHFTVYCEHEKVMFQIQDQGIGIPKVDQQKLFELFYRGSNVDAIPGTGLGLSIVNTLVNLHGGKIMVVSEVDVGSTFTVVLPSVPCSDF
ncbi:PAS domain S-box protein [Anabaena cylindrica FACHB-243]|uniref:histidine kinase n=1 Tax=Anabaena cylindrica (strain ATCC 27899 / PCC 7122) TaxID=272123 RepID=K9ZBZ4_ANACC|nr:MULTISPECIES: PAS domain-containing sensor histidine kinase [Anabaena]AFZ56234.1 PAS/PAC sensor signal transduction histidine kinase [Anabaena cylindrica PCC 7122]MBD2417461.1 PAS domain S-box protein [Anabaena cylindrica FACHB-243]MBY5285636.1 PAS domain S-box protein [Anabaena sp. CCAP 1446/1C]MBY5310954.1 PAS domain S-box protein [Anabaena sp. CCAP 1446/1C]MCM2407630.1 ATP-binding protein [Anabaena sp. CCAP 1446/1C]